MADTETFFEGPTRDYFVKPVLFGDVIQGELLRTWVKDPAVTPDAWTVYVYPSSTVLNCQPLPNGDYFDRDNAIAAAKQLALENRVEALLKGTPTI